MLHLDKPLGRLRSHPLGWRVGRDQFRMFRLQRPQFVQQRIVLGVAGNGIVQHVVAIVMIVDLAPQLCNTFCILLLSH